MQATVKAISATSDTETKLFKHLTSLSFTFTRNKANNDDDSPRKQRNLKHSSYKQQISTIGHHQQPPALTPSEIPGLLRPKPEDKPEEIRPHQGHPRQVGLHL